MLCIGTFRFEQFDETDPPTETEREGTFDLVVDAAGPEEAVDRMRDHLVHLRRTTDFLSGNIEIYLDTVFVVNKTPTTPVLVNYHSYSEALPRGIHNDNPELGDVVEAFGLTDPDEEEAEGGVKILPLLSFEHDDDTSSAPDLLESAMTRAAMQKVRKMLRPHN